MDITPKIIRDALNSTVPYLLKDKMDSFKGQKVLWTLLFNSIDKKEDKISISLYTEEVEFAVWCNINESDFPIIKLLEKNSLLRVKGTISNVSKLYIDLDEVHLQAVTGQDGNIYFSPGSRQSLLSFLHGKILNAQNIKICDPYIDKEVLKLLESATTTNQIRLLGKKIDKNFLENIKAFNKYFNKNVVVKECDHFHDRYYFIDDKVLSVGSSIKNNGGDKATTIAWLDKTDKVVSDFEQWWKTGVELN